MKTNIIGQSSRAREAAEAGKLSEGSRLLAHALGTFYHSDVRNIKRIIPIINCQSNISLRLIDWTVTNYAREKDIVIVKKGPDSSPVNFNIYQSYKSQLKAYSKQLFDPFRRRDRIEFFYEPKKSIETTLGQLNFFRWVLQNDLLDYISENMEDIEEHMVLNKTTTLAASSSHSHDVPKNKSNANASPSNSITRTSKRSSKSCLKDGNNNNDVKRTQLKEGGGKTKKQTKKSNESIVNGAEDIQKGLRDVNNNKRTKARSTFSESPSVSTSIVKGKESQKSSKNIRDPFVRHSNGRYFVRFD